MSDRTVVSTAPPHFALRISGFFLGYFFFGGVNLPFFPVWLQSRGLSEVEIASVIAIPALIRVVLTPLAGLYADLKGLNESGATLLDRTMVLYGSNLVDSNSHVCTNMQVIFAGGGFRSCDGGRRRLIVSRRRHGGRFARVTRRFDLSLLCRPTLGRLLSH